MTNEEAIKNLEIQKCIQKSYAEAYGDDRAKEVEALNMAITVLERQIPKKVYFHDEVLVDGRLITEAICTNCDYVITDDIEYYREPYCPHCGQALDWRRND